MNTFRIQDLTSDTYFSSNLYIDPGFLVAIPEVPLTQETIDSLKQWGFLQLVSQGKIVEAPSVKKLSTKKAVVIDEDDDSIGLEDENRKPSILELREMIEKAQKGLKSLSSSRRSVDIYDSVKDLYDLYSQYIECIYTHYSTNKSLEIDEISDVMRELCVFIKEYKAYILRINPSFEARNKNFIVIHSLRTAVIAVTMAEQLVMAMPKIIELCIACILHEIGMIKLPPQVYLNNKPLTPAEKAQLLTHPIMSYTIIKEAKFPLSIQLAALEHHERENGAGYPRHMRGEQISNFAKIIAVACSFEAISAPRNYKEDRTTYDAMIEILKNPNHQYDDTVLKSLLFSLSLYPVGSYVYLGSGKIAQVVEAIPSSPKTPIIQVLGEEDNDGNPLTVKSNDTDYKIVRVLNKREATDLLKQINS